MTSAQAAGDGEAAREDEDDTARPKTAREVSVYYSKLAVKAKVDRDQRIRQALREEEQAAMLLRQNQEELLRRRFALQLLVLLMMTVLPILLLIVLLLQLLLLLLLLLLQILL